jgi:hypothetical protein
LVKFIVVEQFCGYKDFCAAGEHVSDNDMFIEIETEGEKPAGCVDGRPGHLEGKGPQMLGASLHPIFLAAIYESQKLDRQFVEKKVQILKDSGFGLGVHKGDHREGTKSDCGAADNIGVIIQTAMAKKKEISEIIENIYEQNKTLFAGFSGTFAQELESGFNRLEMYQPENLVLTGDELINTMAELGAVEDKLDGHHGEKTAFVNVKENTTLDVNAANRQGHPGFNLDMWAAVKQSEACGVETGFATIASLILYAATEIVLVENKGKPALDIVVHS